MIKELIILKVLMLIRQVHPKNALDRGLAVCSGCPDVLMTSTGINSIAILDIHGVD